MQITIEIKDPPNGYGTPKRGPIYLPIGSELVLIGNCWVRAADIIQSGGSTWIYAEKLADNQEIRRVENRLIPR